MIELFGPSSLRTSETNYLNEAFSFYAAIRARAYYTRAAREDRFVSSFYACMVKIVIGEISGPT